MKDHADLIAHEAAHAVGLLLQGHGVAEVRVDHERLGELGRVTADFSHSEADYGYLIACLMGPIAGGHPPPSWPSDRDSPVTDEHVAAVLVEHLGLCEREYEAAIVFARTWLDWHEVKGASALLGQALHRVPVISGAQLEELLGPRLARLRHQPPQEEDHDSAVSQAG
jgi:hypothetical protein